jgi:hypothetical protein
LDRNAKQESEREKEVCLRKGQETQMGGLLQKLQGKVALLLFGENVLSERQRDYN